MFAVLLLLALLVPPHVSAELQCLVARPGFGLVSERCPPHTVACRIRIERNAISFYEYSPLYDRNQFVCVLKGEFGEQHGSGCVKKRSGHIRCWCFGRSNCNSPENSKLLYESYLSSDEAKFHAAVEEVDFADLVDEFEPTPPPKIMTRSSLNAKTLPKASNAEDQNQQSSTPLAFTSIAATTPTTATVQTVQKTTKKMANGTTPQSVQGHKSKNSKQSLHAHHHHHHHHQRTTKTTSTSTVKPRTTTVEMRATNATTVGAATLLLSSTVRSVYDRRNRVHVIHVSTRDRYEPVNVFGSETLRKIMAEERVKLKEETDGSVAEEDELGDSDYGEETEWDNDSSAEDASFVEEDQQVSAQISRKRDNEKQMAKANKVAKNRMEQRQRSSSVSKERSEELEEVLGDEYFDSAYYAPASASLVHWLSLEWLILMAFALMGTPFLAI